MKFRAIVCVLLLIAGIGGWNAVVSAQSSTPEPMGAVFVLHAPGGEDGSHLRTDLEPGQGTELVAMLGNQDDKPLALRTYAADAYTLVNGGFGVREEADPQHAPTTWLSYPAETYDLAPGDIIERRFAVAVPEGTLPGSYLVGIVLQTADPLDVPGSPLFRQVIRKMIGVTIVVPGPIVAGAELGEPVVEGDTSGARVVVPLTNVGNGTLRPAGVLSLRNANGEVVVTAPIAMRPVYAGHQTTLEVAIPSQVSAGEYRVDLELADADTGWSGSLSDRPVTLPEPEVPEEPAAVEFTVASVMPVPEPGSGDPPQYADVAVEITNRDVSIPSSRLTMIVLRDGEVVEEVVLSQSLALVEQVTTVERPYIPAAGWQEGTYTFSLVLVSVDPNSGVEAVLVTFDLPDPIVVSA